MIRIITLIINYNCLIILISVDYIMAKGDQR